MYTITCILSYVYYHVYYNMYTIMYTTGALHGNLTRSTLLKHMHSGCHPGAIYLLLTRHNHHLGLNIHYINLGRFPKFNPTPLCFGSPQNDLFRY